MSVVVRRVHFAALLVVITASVLGVAAEGSASRAAVRCPQHNAWRNIVLVSQSTSVVKRDFPDVDNDVRAVVSDGKGGWFIGGGFACVGSQSVPVLAHLRSDGTLDKAWHGVTVSDKTYDSAYSPVMSLARVGHRLFVGGVFGVEALSTTTGSRLWFAPVVFHGVGLEGAQGVDTVAANSRTVYIGGGFTTINGAPAAGIAALNATTGNTQTSWHPPKLTANSAIWTLALDRQRLFVGGGFATANAKHRPGILALNAITGTLLPWQIGTVRGFVNGAGAGDVETITVAQDELLTAGHDGFGVSSATTGAIEPWMYRINGVGYRFASSGPIAYLGGNIRNSFDSADSMPRDNLAAFNIATGKFTSWNPKIDPYVSVNCIAPSGGWVLVAGNFTKSLG